MFARIEVTMRPEFPDPAAAAILRKIEFAHPAVRQKVRWARMIDVHWLDLPLSREMAITAISEIFWDKVLQWLVTGNLIPSAAGKHGSVLDLMESAPSRPGKFWALERRFRPGVTDNISRTAHEAFEIVLGRKLPDAKIASGAMLLLEGPQLGEDALSVIARDVFCNDLIETWTILGEQELCRSDRFHHERIKRDIPRVAVRGTDKTETYALDALSDSELVELSRRKLWALTAVEMRAIRDYFAAAEKYPIRRQHNLTKPTDVEMEILAQTWSEHCKHKIFGARISYKDSSHRNIGDRIPPLIEGLFKETIAGTTEQLHKGWLLSVFEDNAGIVTFDEDDAFCIKVETHNSPSALDPYGGALTGIVGVNRDILGCGMGARPVFNTDVFCLAPPDYSGRLPDRLMHPRRILDGVRRGVEHGGNKSGIPTVNGALVFDRRYLGKPLIYCGTGGLMPRVSAGVPCERKQIKPGDRVVMLGGRIGKDGIHGATFSSLPLDELSPVTAVQLGDPITQKRMADFLIDARELGLFRALTDNGAGGLSSSVGELARIPGGARIDVAKAGVKYPGLKPYELVVSESQERMTLAVPPETIAAFSEFAAKRGVECFDIGEFTSSGAFEIFYEGKVVGCLDLEFLHKGVPRLEMEAEWLGPPPLSSNVTMPPPSLDPALYDRDGAKTLLELLGRPNIASKEWLIRQYDHEVQGMSVVKPLHTVAVATQMACSGPNDGAVIKPKPLSVMGIAVACGICPRLSDLDPYVMAQMAVDEAVRNLICVGADFGVPDSFLAIIDNFCWPDPVGDPQKAAALVRACYGLQDAALALNAPMISGKDSMKNDYRGKLDGRDVTISVPPTLLVTAVARMRDIQCSRTADFKARGDAVYLIGGTRLALAGSELHSMRAGDLILAGEPPRPDWDEAVRIYQWLGGSSGKDHGKIRSLHDVSDGGILTAVAECMIGRGFGTMIQVPVEDGKSMDPWLFSFGEGFHGFVASMAEQDTQAVEAEMRTLGIPFRKIGAVIAGDSLVVRYGGNDARSWSLPVRLLRGAWNKEGYWE